MDDDSIDKFLASGGIPLGGDAPGYAPMPRSSHQTILRSTNLEWTAIVDEERIVRGYQFTLHDYPNAHTYIYRFSDDIRDVMESIMAEMPRVGEPLPPEEAEDDE